MPQNDENSHGWASVANQHSETKRMQGVTYGNRCFGNGASTLWNNRPLNNWNCKTLATFKKKVKTLFFLQLIQHTDTTIKSVILNIHVCVFVCVCARALRSCKLYLHIIMILKHFVFYYYYQRLSELEKDWKSKTLDNANKCTDFIISASGHRSRIATIRLHSG